MTGSPPVGRKITLDDQRSVSLFRNIQPDLHGILFINGDKQTRVMVSTEALDALDQLISSSESEWTWKVSIPGMREGE